jgi:cytidylate kinase
VPLIVAIDGPSGVGKTTASQGVAELLGIPHIDTGAMYRAIALKALRGGVSLSDAAGLEALAGRARVEFSVDGARRVLLDGEDISGKIRTPEVSMAASTISAVPAVRRLLVRLQQELGRSRGGVLEGRDIGTKVFPETRHKFFLTARGEVRAGRRFRELTEKGESVALDQVMADMELRDLQDSSRADSPLTFDDSYTVVDTSDLSISEVIDLIVRSVRSFEGPAGQVSGEVTS